MLQHRIQSIRSSLLLMHLSHSSSSFKPRNTPVAAIATATRYHVAYHQSPSQWTRCAPTVRFYSQPVARVQPPQSAAAQEQQTTVSLMRFAIREAQEDDLPAVAEIEAQSFADNDPLTEGDFLTLLNRPDYYLQVCTTDPEATASASPTRVDSPVSMSPKTESVSDAPSTPKTADVSSVTATTAATPDVPPVVATVAVADVPPVAAATTATPLGDVPPVAAKAAPPEDMSQERIPDAVNGEKGQLPSPKVVGYIIFRIKQSQNQAILLSMAVSKQYRNNHLGKELLTHMLDKVREQKVKLVVLEVGEDNKAAQKLYEDFGFIVTGQLKDHFTKADGSTVDAAMMKLVL